MSLSCPELMNKKCGQFGWRQFAPPCKTFYSSEFQEFTVHMRNFTV